MWGEEQSSSVALCGSAQSPTGVGGCRNIRASDPDVGDEESDLTAVEGLVPFQTLNSADLNDAHPSHLISDNPAVRASGSRGRTEQKQAFRFRALGSRGSLVYAPYGPGASDPRSPLQRPIPLPALIDSRGSDEVIDDSLELNGLVVGIGCRCSGIGLVIRCSVPALGGRGVRPSPSLARNKRRLVKT